jgi:hypothetical protein
MLKVQIKKSHSCKRQTHNGEKERIKRTMGKKKASNAQWGKRKCKTHNAQWGKRKRQTHKGEKESVKRTMGKEKV